MNDTNGAQALIRTLVDSGVDTCFTNPGTSEMHFVAALDQVPEMRGILGLFEGVVTGAADGYARMAGKPAATLLHLGPGLGNGLANLHNARRGRTPVVNIVGDHATYHTKYDAPLESDINAIASAVSGWYRRSMSAEDVAADAADAVAASMTPPGQVATLVLPADTCWSPAPGGAAAPVAPPAARAVEAADIDRVAGLLRSKAKCSMLIGGRALTAAGTRAAARIATATDTTVIVETFPARQERGGGIPALDRLIYLADFARLQLDGSEHLVLVDAVEPVSFFAYPNSPSVITPDGCAVTALGDGGTDPEAALIALAAELGATEDAPSAPLARPESPTGALDLNTFAAAIGATLPEHAIVIDEANTSGISIPAATAGGPRHDWLCLTGGAIGIGLPLATGAAIAAPDRRVVAVQADGSAMYTIQALWTMARENLDVTVVLANNGRYAILDMELDRVGAEAGGSKANAMFDLSKPDMDFVKMAESMGVEATRADTAEDLTSQLARANESRGPKLIEAMVPPIS